VLVRQELQRFLEGDPVEGLVVEVAAELVAALPGVHQAVLQVVADPEVLLLLVVPVGLVVRVVRQQVLRDQTDRRLVPTGLVGVRVLVLVYLGDPAEAGSDGSKGAYNLLRTTTRTAIYS
jgi:hypothetical protein